MANPLPHLAALLLLTALSAPARLPVVEHFELQGVSALRQPELWQLIKSRPGLLRHPAFSEQLLDQDIETVLSYYQSEGYHNARLVRRQVERQADGDVRILLEFEEGTRTRIGSLEWVGVQQVPEEALRAQLKLRAGRPFRLSLLGEDLRALQIFYAERGMVNARIGYSAVEDSGHSVRLVYNVEEGPPVRVGQILVHGLDKTRPQVVLRQLRLRPGDLFTYSLIQQSQLRIYATGLFRTVLVEPAPVDSAQPAVRDLLVTLRERQAGSLDLGAGWGTSERFRAGASLSQDNWRGRGMQYGLSGRFSRLLRRGEGAFTAPRLRGLPLSLDVRLFYHWNRNRRAGFTAQSTGTDFTLSYHLGRAWQTNLTYLLKWVELQGQRQSVEERPLRSSSSLTLALSRDVRDDLLDPRRGSFLQGRIEYAGGLLRGESAFLRSSASATLYHPLLSLVWAFHLHGQHIRPLRRDEEIFQDERFYLGGDRSVRGFEREQIGADRLGLVALNVQSEVRFPLSEKMGGVLFVDGGQVWRKVGQVQVQDLRPGYGGGLRYQAPFGLVRLDAGMHGGFEKLRQRLEIYLGIGQGF